MVLSVTLKKLFHKRRGVPSLGPLSDPFLLHFNSLSCMSPTGFPWQNCRTLGKDFREGRVVSVLKEWSDVMCLYSGGHCYTGKSTLAFNFIFLALITRSMPSSPCGIGSFEPALCFGRRQVLKNAAPVIAVQCCFKVCFSALVLPCWLLISFWLLWGSSWLVFPLASRAGSLLQRLAAVCL